MPTLRLVGPPRRLRAVGAFAVGGRALLAAEQLLAHGIRGDDAEAQLSRYRASQRRLPRSRQPHHYDEGGPAKRRGVASGQIEIDGRSLGRRLLLSRADLRLVEGQAQHLAPHPGAIAAVEGKEAEQPRVPRLRRVSLGEVVAEVGPSPRVEIHGEEGDLARHVAAAEAIAELDAVEDADAVGDTHALATHVAVAVDHVSLPHPSVEERMIAAQALAYPAVHRLEGARADGATDEGTGLREVLLPVA